MASPFPLSVGAPLKQNDNDYVARCYKSTEREIEMVLQMDLVDEMQWEDVAAANGLFVSLEEAGFEESHRAPEHGVESVIDYVMWFSDGEDSRYEN